LVICQVEEAHFLVVNQLGASERGAGGFGHSGR
jgi:dUTPase